jgi:hypothetical protein
VAGEPGLQHRARNGRDASNFTALVWDVVLPMDTLDETAMFAFYTAHGERNNPEKRCAAPTPTPAPATPTPAATPASTPGATPSASPAGTTGP